MIKRTSDPTVVNKIVNDPSVYYMVSFDGDTEYDLSGFISNQNNIVLVNDDETGCFLFHFHEPGVYEVHTCLTDEVRGKEALKLARKAAEYMFFETDCVEILTKVPEYNKAADWFTRAMKFSFEFEGISRFRKNGELVPMKYYALRLQEWVKWADGLVEEGQRFHDKLHAEKDRVGHHTVDHPEDEAHNRYVGMAVKMIYGGQIAKAIVFFNRWARFAWYAPIDIVSLDPLIIDIKDGYIRVTDNDFSLEV